MLSLSQPDIIHHFPDYKNGDELSENLYRIVSGLPIRCGHSADEYYEDSMVILRAMTIYLAVLYLYRLPINWQFFVPMFPHQMLVSYTTAKQFGLGNCKYQGLGIK
jgi:hypothetical protein